LQKNQEFPGEFNLTFRFVNAVIAGKILNLIFTNYNLFNEPNNSILQVPIKDVSNLEWAISQLQNFFLIFLIIFFLLKYFSIKEYICLGLDILPSPYSPQAISPFSGPIKK